MVLDSGIIIYFFTYLLQLHPETLLFFLFFFVTAIILYIINNKNIVLHKTTLHAILKKQEQQAYHGRVKSKIETYREASKRPKITHTIIPLTITLAVAYLLLNNMIFFSVVTSGSMEPVLKKNDLVLIQNIYVEPQQGDIIMFNAEQRLPVIHRIHTLTPEGIKTKGDAVENPDSWTVQKTSIEGEVVIYNNKPIILKNIGTYFNFDTERRTDIKYSETFQQISKILKNFKKMGLIIFILCIMFYIINSSKR